MNFDMDLCSGDGCKLKDKCVRYLTGVEAIRIEWAPCWWTEPVFENGNCILFIQKKEKLL